jgi:3-hydroxyacyl-CoA dehydrogenase
MDLKSGYPYWAVKNGLMYAFPQLDADLSCDVAVVGAGITGALIADELAGHGHAVVMPDQRDWRGTPCGRRCTYRMKSSARFPCKALKLDKENKRCTTVKATSG